MRSTAVFLTLAAMSGLFVVLQATRKPTAHRSSIAPPTPTKKAADAKPAPKKQAKKSALTGKKKAAPEKPLPPRMNRPLRVASLGWELIAPGVVANGGADPAKGSAFSKERIQVHLTAFTRIDELEAALARGGADPNGADIAILPLPELTASYERLRALSPQIFLVLGWSRGRDGLLAAKEAALARPPRGGRLELAAERGSSPAFLALFLLEAAGVPVKRVSFVDPSGLYGRDRPASRPGAATRRAPAFAALERPLSASARLGELKFVATTADARRLIPILAVAPAGLLASHGGALAAWGQVWLGGVEQLERDVPAAARQVSALKLAPPAIELLGRLGGIESASLAENARLFALSGRDPVTLEELFRRSWALWRASGVLTSPGPERAPVQGEAVAQMVRTYPTMVEAVPAPSARPRAPTGTPTRPGERLFSHAPAAHKASEVLPALAFLAAVFDRSALKVSWRESLGQARALCASVSGRFDLPRPERLSPAAHKAGPPIAIEVSAP